MSDVKIQNTSSYKDIRKAERILAAVRNENLDEFIVAGTKYKGKNPSIEVVKGIPVVRRRGIPFIKIGKA